MIPRKGDRVRMVGIMPNDPAPIPVGEEGTVVDSEYAAQTQQIDVEWDSGRTLILLTTDPFVVIGHVTPSG